MVETSRIIQNSSGIVQNTNRIVCPKCDDDSGMRQIGGWKEDGSPSALRTFWCTLCKKVWAETYEQIGTSE